MRKFLFVFLAFPVALLAQNDYKNSLKVNVVGAATQIVSFQYERMLGTNFSINNTFFYRPKTFLPFGTQIDKAAKKYSLGLTGVNFEHVFMDLAKVGVKGYSPELRYYFGYKKSRWFVGAFGQFEAYDALIPASLDLEIRGFVLTKVPLDFDIRTISGGILVGRHFRLGNRLSLDLVIIGPHFGKATKVHSLLENTLIGEMNASERELLIRRIKERFSINETYFDVSVADQKAEIKALKPVPYLGIRAVGLNFGFNF